MRCSFLNGNGSKTRDEHWEIDYSDSGAIDAKLNEPKKLTPQWNFKTGYSTDSQRGGYQYVSDTRAEISGDPRRRSAEQKIAVDGEAQPDSRQPSPADFICHRAARFAEHFFPARSRNR